MKYRIALGTDSDGQRPTDSEPRIFEITARSN